MSLGEKREWTQASVYGWQGGDLLVMAAGGRQVLIPGSWTFEALDPLPGLTIWLEMAGDRLVSVVWDEEKPTRRGDY